MISIVISKLIVKSIVIYFLILSICSKYKLNLCNKKYFIINHDEIFLKRILHARLRSAIIIKVNYETLSGS